MRDRGEWRKVHYCERCRKEVFDLLPGDHCPRYHPDGEPHPLTDLGWKRGDQYTSMAPR